MSNEAEAKHLQLVEDPPAEDRAPSIPPPDPLVGRTIDGRYRIERVLGEGGMGLVYAAKHAVLQKPLAIKVLRPEVSRDQEVMSRFQQEAQSASAIGSQHIIDISDFGTLPDNSTYFVMEYLDGQALTDAIEARDAEGAPLPMDPARVVHISKQLCVALGAAHERSIVHRDLKPDNIFLIKRGGDPDFVKVLDFGIAKVGGSSSKLTKAGQVFGTPHYMSPEQCAGTGVDHRTDIYALGVIIYEMSCGRVPFDADNLMGILTKHMYEQPLPPHQLPPPVNVPPGLEAVILKCLTKSADARYQTMAELREDLVALEQGMTPRAVVEGVDRASGVLPPRVDGTGRLAVGSMIRMGAGEAPPEAPPSRTGLYIGLAVAALAALALVGGAIAMSGGTEIADAPDTTPQPPPETVEVVDPVGAGESGAGETAGTDTDVEAQGVEAPPVVRVHLETDPPQVEVYRGDALLGNTPFDVTRPVGDATLSLTLRMPGYVDQTVQLSALTSPDVRIALERERRGAGRRPRETGGTTTAAGSGSTAAGTGASTTGTGAATGSMTTSRPGGGSVGQSEVLDPWR